MIVEKFDGGRREIRAAVTISRFLSPAIKMSEGFYQLLNEIRADFFGSDQWLADSNEDESAL